jgi:integrase
LRKQPAGIYHNSQTDRWDVDKTVDAVRLRCRGFKTVGEAKEWIRNQSRVLPSKPNLGENLSFLSAATRYIDEKRSHQKPSSTTDTFHLKSLAPYIGHLQLHQVTDSTLSRYLSERSSLVKAKTLHLELSFVQAVLNRAARSWVRSPTLWRPPVLTKPVLTGQQRLARPLTWSEQEKMLKELPTHLRDMSEFAAHTGARDNVIVNLRWDWLIEHKPLKTVVFDIPRMFVKGRRENRLLILNSAAQTVIERQRGRHHEFVFVWRRERSIEKDSPTSSTYAPVETMNNTAWQSARVRAGMPDLRVHDLRATFATRLADRGVTEPVIAELLWHSRHSVTRRYLVSHLSTLVQAVELIARPSNEHDEHDVSISTLRKQARTSLRLTPR